MELHTISKANTSFTDFDDEDLSYCTDAGLSKTYGEGMKWGNGITFEDNSEDLASIIASVAMKGFTNMSFAMVAYTGREIYLAADSRVSEILSLSPEGSVLDSRVLCDDAQKIVLIDEHTAVVSTGLYTFGDNGNYPDIVSSIDLTGKSIEDKAIALNDTFAKLLPNNKSIQLILASTANGRVSIANINAGKRLITTNYIITPDMYKGWDHIGIPWGKPIIDKVSANTAEEFIHKCFADVYGARQYHDQTVGGPVHILRLTHSGYEWI